jgi:type III secretion protein L
MTTLRLEIVRAARPVARQTARDAAGVFVSQRRAEATDLALRVLAEARDEADRMLAGARSDADAIRRAAHDEGRAAGERRWSEAALALAERRSEALENLERDCVHLAIEIARQIVGASVSAGAAAVEEIAARACAPLRRDAALVVRVAASHAERVSALRDRLGESRAVTIEIDPSLGDADCVAECAGIRVDARLDVQLANIRRRLLGERDEEAVP